MKPLLTSILMLTGLLLSAHQARAQSSAGADAPEDEFEGSPTADVGIDLALDSRRRFVARVGASLGERHAIAVGLSVG